MSYPPFSPGIVYRILMVDFRIVICCTTVCTTFYFINLTMSLVVYNVSHPNAHRFSRKSDLNTNPESVFQFVSIKFLLYSCFFPTPLLMRTVYPCSIAASELVSDITVRIGTTKFYLHKVSDMLFSFI